MVKVSLIQGENRYENVFSALKQIEGEIREKIKSKKHIVLKPNFVSSSIQLAATHVEAVLALLDFLKPITNEKITIAESAALGTTEEGFKNFGYYALQNHYNIELKDLTKDTFTEEEIFDQNLKPLKIRIANTILQSDFRISLAMLKTHDTVVATLTLKNMIVGSLEHKSMIHQGYKAINLNLAKLAEIIPPHLSVIDGFLGMEGEGPVEGTPVQTNLALAGKEFLAVDALGSYVMGFDISQIGYLYYCQQKKLGEGNIKNIQVVGNANLEEIKKQFKPHSTFAEQLKWR